MSRDDLDVRLNRLESVLRDILCILPTYENPDKAEEIDTLFNKVCELLFTNDLYQSIWSERLLLQVNALFSVKKPNEVIFKQQLLELSEKTEAVRKVNDLFFVVLDNKATLEDIIERLKALMPISEAFSSRFRALNKIEDIKLSNLQPSEKISLFVGHLAQDFSIDLGEAKEQIDLCLQALKHQEVPGKVGALLINSIVGSGILLQLEVKVQQGKGDIIHCVKADEGFKAAVERARQAALSGGFILPERNVLYTLQLTEADYTGDSIPLAAASAMCFASAGKIIDPYTAFSGGLNIDSGEWKVKGITGVTLKLEAARRDGCRRVFLPKENQVDVNSALFEDIRIIFVDDLIEVLVALQSSAEPIPGDSLQIRKVNLLRSVCDNNGWNLSHTITIQSGLQFTIMPFDLPSFKVNIYSSGAHTPKTHAEPRLRSLLEELASLDKRKVPVQKVQQAFSIADSGLRSQIQEALEKLKPTEQKKENFCDYGFVLEREQEKLTVKQFTSGKLVIQGRAGKLYRDALEAIIALYNLNYPKAKLVVDDYLENESGLALSKSSTEAKIGMIPLPHMGTDESGKGDYFGPMVIAGVLLDQEMVLKLESLGVKDSKLLSDERCRALAEKIRVICIGRYHEVEIGPSRYNSLYKEFRKEGKNLNHLLAWGHARAIESLLERHMCSHAIADQFGDEKYIISKLMEKGKDVNLIQTTKGERYLAVAAASILARDRFLSWIDKASAKYGLVIPKGSSASVVEIAQQIAKNFGENELSEVVKIHHKTTLKVLHEEK